MDIPSGIGDIPEAEAFPGFCFELSRSSPWGSTLDTTSKSLELREVILTTSDSFEVRHLLVSVRNIIIFELYIALEGIWPELWKKASQHQ